jgi:hypothetical protein
MRRGGSGVAGAGAESGGGLTGAGASGWAVAIDPVRVGAASSTSADTGAETALWCESLERCIVTGIGQ